MSNFDGIIAVLGNNRQDIEDLINKFGGIGNVIMAAPSLIRIMRTMSEHKDPVQAAENARLALDYNKETENKVREFQTKYKLDVDGLVGNQTWGKVEELLKAQPVAAKPAEKK